ncbi:sialidase family protein [Poriferisphaera corsica]|uniref:sialidase family protein n=1 Tax=Poriferisphaera corsica TaxID=2528020 RepID=UPI0011AB1E46|nr:sialidase family protein [Poriferisphaera corsica]
MTTETVRRDDEHVIVCWLSDNDGRDWREQSVIKTADKDVDLGDGHLIELQDGVLLFSYRYNLYRGVYQHERSYRIAVSASRDEGRTWSDHSIVAESNIGDSQVQAGLWASFLYEDTKGNVFCLYDDEEWPNRIGFKRHQWVTMKKLNRSKKTWGRPRIVGRASNKKELSRDGMPSAVSWENGEVLVVFESVDPNRPHANVINATRSYNGGASWNWRKNREVVYRTKVKNHLAISPWITRIGEDGVICVFATDEDESKANRSGTPPHKMRMSLKYILSADRGRTWSKSYRLNSEAGSIYKPGVGVVGRTKKNNEAEVLVMYQDFKKNGFFSFHGRIKSEAIDNE